MMIYRTKPWLSMTSYSFFCFCIQVVSLAVNNLLFPLRPYVKRAGLGRRAVSVEGPRNKLKKIFNVGMLLLAISTTNAQPPNFIIFIADDVSWDDLGCYGNMEVQTPIIDGLAESGLRFTNMYLTASSCSPSRNSIITGRYPHNTGAAELHTQPPLDMVSLPEVLSQNGYYTAQSGKFHMGKYAERGFTSISSTRAEIGDGGESTWVKTLEERPKDQPFFMWFAALDAHRAWGENPFSGTHNPEEVTPPFYLANGNRTKQDLAKYYDEIKRFDHSIGEVINTLKIQGVEDNTIIMVMADNGRPFPHSKTRVNDRGMKTPFVWNWPAQIKQPATVDALVSVIDMAPTICDLAGVMPISSMQGQSFKKLLSVPTADFRNYVFAEHNWHDYEAYERMVRNKDFMYIFNGRPSQPQMGPADAVGSPSFDDLLRLKAKRNLTAIQADVFATPRANKELYDLQRDPQQLVNVAVLPDYKDALGHLSEVMDQWQQETGDDMPEVLTQDWYQKSSWLCRNPLQRCSWANAGSGKGSMENYG